MGILTRYRSFPPSVRLLLLNQLTINIGFYMLIPYVADHLSAGLGLATWLVGLVLGVRNFAQQGMFLVGGSLADRFGYKPLIVAGCALRTVGFALLGLVDSVPALVVASAATGFAGALFNPAVRAYLAADAGPRRIEAFALFSIFYQAGILIGPLVGLALTGIAFSVTCLTAAGLFALLTVLQVRALPAGRGGDDTRSGSARVRILAQWRDVARTRGFLPFALAMTGFYVLSYQVYLALPVHARSVVSTGGEATVVVAAVFAVSGGVTVAGQMRVTAWCRVRWGSGRALSRGLAVLGLAFVPLLLADLAGLAAPQLVDPTVGTAVDVAALLATAFILALGTAVVAPFEMDTIVALSRDRLVATHYGLYNTVCGVGILLGNLGTGWALDLARSAGLAPAPWGVLSAVGLLSAAGLAALDRRGLLSPESAPAGRPTAPPVRVQEKVARAPRARRLAAPPAAYRDPPTEPLWAVPTRQRGWPEAAAARTGSGDATRSGPKHRASAVSRHAARHRKPAPRTRWPLAQPATGSRVAATGHARRDGQPPRRNGGLPDVTGS